MGELTDFLDAIPASQTPRELGETLRQSLKCKHDIIAEWCSDCKRMDTPSIKQVLYQENLEIAENLLSWEKKTRTT
jgi:hypothetical protein